MNAFIGTRDLSDGLSVRENVTAEEWQVRVDRAACYRLVAHFGWTDLIFTHISARVPGPENHFLLNPYGLYFHETTASSLIKVDLDGKIVMPGTHDINPAGFTIHSAIHAARHDVGCVIHLHTANGCAVAAQKNGLLPISQKAMVVNTMLAYHDYEGVALDHGERERLVRDLGTNALMILRNHGTLAAASSIPLAFMLMHMLEKSCEFQVGALSAGQDGLTFPPPEIEAVIQRQLLGMGGPPGALAWPGLLRMLDRQDSTFRD